MHACIIIIHSTTAILDEILFAWLEFSFFLNCELSLSGMVLFLSLSSHVFVCVSSSKVFIAQNCSIVDKMILCLVLSGLMPFIVVVIGSSEQESFPLPLLLLYNNKCTKKYMDNSQLRYVCVRFFFKKIGPSGKHPISFQLHKTAHYSTTIAEIT